jgi:hypothetical protein
MKNYYFLLAVQFLIVHNSSGQHATVIGSKYVIAYKKHFGNIILNNGENIKGVFEYAEMEFPTYNFKYFSNSGKLIKRYKISDLSSITLAGSDTTLSNKDSTYFIRIGKYLYRQLTFGSIKIFDPLININERNGIVKPDDLIIFKNDFVKTFHSEEDIIKYIQDRLKEKNIEKSFKSIPEVIRYLNYSSV